MREDRQMDEGTESREWGSEWGPLIATTADSQETAAPDTPSLKEETAAPDTPSLKERILVALKNVVDPELGINIVDLGLVYEVDVQGDAVHITYTLTTMGCPIGPLIEAEMKQFLSGIEGLSSVEAEMVLRPPWTPEMMSDEAKAALGYF
jgi:metal-sulfur cluster biosynthetic enzyme